MGRGRKGRNKTNVIHIRDYNGPEIDLNPKIFGPNMKAYALPAAFFFISGGVGDYINWASAIKYMADTYPHVDGRIFTSPLFLDVARYLFGHLPRWKVENRDDFLNHIEDGCPMSNPRSGTQLLNACGAHLMDLGANYFLCLDRLPDSHNFLIPINYEGPWRWPELDPEEPFAVFTPGATADVRAMPVPAFNELVEYTRSKGIKPVFLGKCELSEEYIAKFQPYNFSKGVDLRERTTLLESTQIMNKAKFVIGLDNGLLHMAGTGTAPVIFGQNITEIRHRTLRRKAGLTINVTVSEENLHCIGCQSKIRFVMKHDFRDCFFKVNPNKYKVCLQHLFKNNCNSFKNAIDTALREGPKHRETPRTIDMYI